MKRCLNEHTGFKFDNGVRTLLTFFNCLFKDFAVMGTINQGDTTFNVIQYAKADSNNNWTDAIQAAVDAAASNGGGVVSFSAGTYPTGTIRLYSNIALNIQPGAEIVASDDLSYYPVQPEGAIPPEFPEVHSLFTAYDAENITICGGGTVDGAGRKFMDYSAPLYDELFTNHAHRALPHERQHEYVSEHDAKRPSWLFFFRRCRGVRIQDFSIVDSARWTFRFSASQEISVKGLTIRNELRAANSDGMHFTGCNDVIVADCIIASGDDCIAITTYGDSKSASRDIIVHNCVLRSHSAGVRIGFGDNGLLENVTVSNCKIHKSNRGVALFAGAGSTVRRIRILNTDIETRLIGGTWWGKGEPVFITTLGSGATIESVELSGVTCHGEQGLVAYSNEQAVIRDLRISNVRLSLSRGPLCAWMGQTLDRRPTEQITRTVPPVLLHRIEAATISGLDVEVTADAAALHGRNIMIESCTKTRIEGYTENLTDTKS